MRQARVKPHRNRASILRSLKLAVVQGATWRYDHLVSLAIAAGASDDEIDTVASEAIQALLTGAEQPFTETELALEWPVGQFRA